MSETATLEVLQKKRTELENQWSSKQEKHRTLEGDIKTLEEKVQSQLQEKIQTEDTVLETLESKRKELEKRFEELQKQEHPELLQRQDEPSIELTKTNEEAQVQEQPVEIPMTATSSDDQWPKEEVKEKHKEEKKRRWV